MPEIKLFDGGGGLLVTEENCPDDLRERFPAFKAAHAAMIAADAALEDAQNRVASCVTQIGSLQQYIRRYFPPRGEADRIAAARLTFRQNRNQV